MVIIKNIKSSVREDTDEKECFYTSGESVSHYINQCSDGEPFIDWVTKLQPIAHLCMTKCQPCS